MKFKLFNATTMHNSTEKCKQKIQKIRFKSKKSDLNQKNPIFFDFLIKIMIFSNPDQSPIHCSEVCSC